MGGCSLLPPTLQVLEPARCPTALGDESWWSGCPALFLASCSGCAGLQRALTRLAALPFCWPLLGSMP